MEMANPKGEVYHSAIEHRLLSGAIYFINGIFW